MELGLTFPLQRFLKVKTPEYGTESDRRFCWDLHVIDLRGHKSLLAVHCHSRYTFVRYDVSPFQWADIPGLFREGLLDSLTAAGFSNEQASDYLRVLALDLCLDTSNQAQPLLDHAVNTRPSRCVGYEGLGLGLERMALILTQ